MAQAQLDRGTIRYNLQGFVARWRTKIHAWTPEERRRSEKSHAQTFWGDFLQQFGVISAQANLFEIEATRATTGNRGYIDVFWSSVFIGEAKSVGKDLAEAEKQARDYLAGGSIRTSEWPRYVLCTDFLTFRLTRLGTERWTETFSLDELVDHVDQLVFLAGQETVTKAEERDASFEASKIMASLYTAMLGEDADEPVGDEAPRTPEEEDAATQAASVFLTRVLFLLYGDDAGLWEADLFYRFVLNDTTADNLGPQLRALFDVLNTKNRRHVPESMAKFPYVNGALYADPMPGQFFTPAMRDALLDACRFRWTRISPAVFGSMFQMVKSREARHADGTHYTTEANILKTIGPLFLDELQAEADRLCRNASTTQAALVAFRDRLATHVFLDPACGSGNFLTVAYARLRTIETQIIVELRKRQGLANAPTLDATLETRLTIDQFHGIEVSWWPAKIAETAMFLVDHQANRELALAVGVAPDRLPIEITAHIHHANALTSDWTDLVPEPRDGGVTYVFGNPPFLGHETRSPEQAMELRAVWRAQDIGRLDYVTGWHAQALAFLAKRAGEFAYVTTNSITQGDQVPRLFRPLRAAGWRIKFAHRTFAWTSEAPGKAAVHCVIVGFTRDQHGSGRLWDYLTPTTTPTIVTVATGINAYLVDGPPALVESARHPLSAAMSPAAYGNMPRDDGALIVERADYDAVMADPVAAQYVRPFIGARQLIHNEPRWCLWLVDMDPQDVRRSPILTERLRHVAEFRGQSTASSTRSMAVTPGLFGQRSQPDTDFLCIPIHVSESRRYFPANRYPSDVIASNATFIVQDPDGLQFAVISSSMFLAWQKAIGGRIKSDLRFASTLTWNTFPLPALDTARKQAIVAAGAGVIQARGLHPERSLAQHYTPLAMDPTLVTAHNRLDREVDRAFGSPRRLTSERQRLELLFAEYDKLIES